jgi:hypothetical protein
MSKNVEDAEKLADKYFAFLVTDYGFAKVNGYYASYEYNFGYRKGNIEIHLQCDADGSSIPFIELHDYSQMSAMRLPARYPLIGIEMKPAIKKIFADRNEREKFKREKFPILSDHVKEYIELGQADYDKYGRNEMEILIRENTEIIQGHPEILRGDLSLFPKKESKGPVRTTIAIRQPDGKMKATEYIDGKKVDKGGFARWLRSIFNAK